MSRWEVRCRGCAIHSLDDDVTWYWLQWCLVRDMLMVLDASREFRAFARAHDERIRALLTRRVCVAAPEWLYPRMFQVRRPLECYLKLKDVPPRAVNACSVLFPRDSAAGTNTDDARVELPPEALVTAEEARAWAATGCEEMLGDLASFAEVVENRSGRQALTYLLLELQRIKHDMWATRVSDIEEVHELLHPLLTDNGYKPGWSVLGALLQGKSHARRRDVALLSADRAAAPSVRHISREWLQRWKSLSSVAGGYMELRDVLFAVLALSEVADHPSAARHYSSVWSAVDSCSGASNRSNEKGTVARVRDLDEALVGDYVAFYFRFLITKIQRMTFLESLLSLKTLAGR